jgi:hypothetical protein
MNEILDFCWISKANQKYFKIISYFFILCCILSEYSMAGIVHVNTTSGIVIGLDFPVLNQNINQFLGIPYAEPPLGSLRFAKPKPIVKPIKVSIDLIVFLKSNQII